MKQIQKRGAAGRILVAVGRSRAAAPQSFDLETDLGVLGYEKREDGTIILSATPKPGVTPFLLFQAEPVYLRELEVETLNA